MIESCWQSRRPFVISGISWRVKNLQSSRIIDRSPPLSIAETLPGPLVSTAISEMTTDLQHISGKNNVVTDALSRVFTIVNQPIDWSTFATGQGTDPNIPLFATAITGLKIDHVMVAGHSIVCDISSGLPCPLVPATWIQTVFDLIHSLSHPGVKAFVYLILCHFVWHNAKKDISRLARACLACQTSKVQKHTRHPVQVFEAPSGRFGHVHVDIVGPLPISQGCR